MRLAYRYRLYPTKAQEARLNEWLESLRLLYNFALAERKDVYKAEKRSVSVYEQTCSLKDLKRRFSRYANINAQVLQDAIFRLDKAFDRFFGGGGYPRFKAKERYRSFTHPQNTAFRILEGGKKIRLSKIGNVKLRYHRLLEGKQKTATVIRYPSGKWYVSICCELPDTPIRDAPLAGFDLGLTSFLTTSDGTATKPLEAFKKAGKMFRREQRRLCRKERSSENRRKQRRRVARAHEKVTNRRRDFVHKTSRRVVDSSCGLILDRDHNAAINVVSRAGTVRSHACGEVASTNGAFHPQVASQKQEAPPSKAG